MTLIVFHSQARAELDEAIAYYEKQRKGLGLGLLAEIEKSARRIELSPAALSDLRGDRVPSLYR